MKNYYKQIKIPQWQQAIRRLRLVFLAVVFALPALTGEMAYADITNVPQTYMGQNAATAQTKLGNLGNFLVALTNKTYMIGILVILLAGIIGAILWCFGQRGFVIGVLGAIVIIGVIIMVVGLVIDQTATGGTGATGAVIVFLP